MYQNIRITGLLPVLAFVLAACSDQVPTGTSADAAAPSASYGASTWWGQDQDYDGLDDGVEWELANRYAPVVHLPNLISQSSSDDGDWTRPANVQWYLANTRMRFHHNNCSDHQLLDFGQVNAQNLVTQTHRVGNGLPFCSHGSAQSSAGGWDGDEHYFLQQHDWTHPGQSEAAPEQWLTYFHAYRNTSGGVSIQYWLLWAYNDWTGYSNHEGDWEHINVRLGSGGEPEGVYFAAHNGINWYSAGDVTWFGTHPGSWVADGSHGQYRSEYACDTTMYPPGLNEGECWTIAQNRWFTWSGGKGWQEGLQGGGLVNMGEKNAPMPGQQWVKYSGRWGEVGTWGNFYFPDWTSGPKGPAYKEQGWWTTDALPPPSYGGGGGSGGGECNDEPMRMQETELIPTCPV